jgi:hypothetical protein
MSSDCSRHIRRNFKSLRFGNAIVLVKFANNDDTGEEARVADVGDGNDGGDDRDKVRDAAAEVIGEVGVDTFEALSEVFEAPARDCDVEANLGEEDGLEEAFVEDGRGVAGSFTEDELTDRSEEKSDKGDQGRACIPV